MVNACSVASPDTGSGARCFERQAGQRADHGWIQWPQSWQRRKRNSPSAPPVQKYSLVLSRRGRRRDGFARSVALVIVLDLRRRGQAFPRVGEGVDGGGDGRGG